MEKLISKFIYAIILTIFTSFSFSSCSKEDDEGGSKSIDSVDLGLPSGTKWASCNLGASKPEESGNYYAWGETTPKTKYDESTYIHCNGAIEGKLLKYCDDNYRGIRDDKYTLDPVDDAAHVNLKGSWRMPTKDDFVELVENCILTWTTVNGVYGYLVKSTNNNNSIFLPAAGCHDKEGKDTSSLIGCYWTSSLHKGGCDYAYSFGFRSDYYGYKYKKYYPGTEYDWRADGLTIRPVCQ